MSCCDGMQMTIQNLTGVTATIQSVDTHQGTISGFSAGDTIAPNGGKQSGTANSSSGTNGSATGQITLSLQGADGGDAEVVQCNYVGHPQNVFGKCPCDTYPSAVSSDNYLVTTSNSNGDHGNAVETYIITVQ